MWRSTSFIAKANSFLMLRSRTFGVTVKANDS